MIRWRWALLTPILWASAFAADGLPEVSFARYMHGKYVFERNCILCHGARGDGKGEMAASLSPKPRSFREGMFKFRSTPTGKLPTDDDLRHTIRHGLSGTAMGMFSQLQSEDVESVIAYVKSFSRRWRKQENYAKPINIPEAPKWLKEPDRIAAGKVIFMQNCAACHGPEAKGDGPAISGLKDIWGHPAQPSDLRQPHLRSGNNSRDLFLVLSTGLDGTPMASFESVLTPEKRWEVIAWLLSQRLPAGKTLGSSPSRLDIDSGKSKVEPER